MTDTRGAVQVTDVAMTFFVLVALIVVAPWYYEFISWTDDVADPFTALLLQLGPPLMFVALIVSVGISARRGGF